MQVESSPCDARMTSVISSDVQFRDGIAVIGAIHFKEHLLKKVVADVARGDGFVWRDNSCHLR
jgi:hypothetical protein